MLIFSASTFLLFTACQPSTIKLDEDAVGPGVDPVVPAAEGEARAGLVVEDGEAALFGGVNAEGAAGDVKIYNHLVQFVIQGAYDSHGLIHTGGGVIDADLVRPDGALGRDTVEDLFLGFGMSRLFRADEVAIVADGSDGGAAVVCARGTDVPWEYLQGLLEMDEPVVPELNLDIVTTYELPPDSHTLTVTSVLTNVGDEDIVFSPQDGVFMSGEELLPWAPGRGFEGPDSGALEVVGFVGRRGEAALTLWPAEGEYVLSVLSELAAGLGVFIADLPSQELGPGDSVSLSRHITVAPDVSRARAERWETLGEPLGGVSGTVTDAGGPVAGARVHFVDGDDEVGVFAMTGPDGAYEARLPPGEWTAYAVGYGEDEVVALPEGAGRYGPFTAASINGAQLDVLRGDASAPDLDFAVGREAPPPQGVTVSADGASQLDFEMALPGAVRVSITDTDGAPLPAVLELRWADGAHPPTTIPDTLREALNVPSGSRAAWAWTGTGSVEIPALPGSYSVWGGHSWRHDQDSVEGVEVVAGEVAEVALSIDEIVPRDGWLAVDPHLHGAPSFDGALPMEDRLIACAATGVDLPIPTDHDAQGDYRELMDALGFSDRMTIIPGVEVSTLLRGHFNMYPIEPEPLSLPNGGAPRWWDIPEDTEQLFEWMRDSAPEDALVQVNHPRSPGMFALAGYDPELGEADNPESWSWDFDAFELWNGGVDGLEDVREDWFSFLNAGRVRIPTGVSDSHYRYIPCGMGHTDLYLDTTDPAGVSVDAVRDALVAGHVVVASGVTLRAALSTGGETALPGDTIGGGSATLSARVLSPEWVIPTTLRVYRNGELLIEEALPAESEGGVWFDGWWTVEAGADAWFAVEVVGETSQGSAWRDALPYAMTNAFFLDVDGGGWSAPGL